MYLVYDSAGREPFQKRRGHAKKYLGFARIGEYDEKLVEELEDRYLGRGKG